MESDNTVNQLGGDSSVLDASQSLVVAKGAKEEAKAPDIEKNDAKPDQNQ